MLNTLQQKAYDMVVNEQHPIVYLKGSAGCGKSYVISEIAKHTDCILTATSHQAKTVLAKLTNKPTQTIHSYLGYILVKENYKQVLKQKLNHTIQQTRLLIVDEISMIPNKLLKKLIEYAGLHYTQLLIVGDMVQLPAVNDTPKFNKLNITTIELTEQMRQSSCTKLQNYLSTYRTAIINNKEPETLFAEIDSINIINSHKEFCQEYIKCKGNKKILAYKNTVVDKYNQNIVQGNIFNVGDDVIIDKPIYKIANNQDILTIKTVKEKEEYFLLDLQSDEGKTATVRHYKSVSNLNTKLETLKTKKQEQEYWDLWNISFRLKHSFASTVHKAQGTTVDYIFLDAYDIVSSFEVKPTRYTNPITLDMFLRLLYVGISRMKIKCFIYTGEDNKGRDYSELQKDPYRKVIVRKKKIKSKPNFFVY